VRGGRTDDDYADECRELLVKSVTARLHPDGRVAATLSGGVDSSSVAVVAHLLVRDRQPPPLFSMIYPDHPESDERRYIAAVASRCGSTPALIPPAPPTRPLAERAAAWLDAPAMAADRSCEGLWTAIRRAGCVAALTGAGGDFTYAGSIFHYADLLRAGRLLTLAKRYRDDGAADDTGRGPFALIQAGAWPALPVPVKRLLRPVAVRAGARLGAVRQPAWLRLPVEKEVYPEQPRAGSFAVEDLVRALTGGFHSYVLEGSERVAAEAGIELRHPLLDVRLTEFVLSLPEEQRRRGPLLKFVLRHALRRELPPEVATRTTKGDFSHSVWEAIESLGGEAFYRSLAIADAGWIDGAAALRIYQQMRDDLPRGHKAFGAHVPDIWMITAIELWFRAAFAPARAAAL
jgi:asparagine synthase (glutamine-hydrolysing)